MERQCVLRARDLALIASCCVADADEVEQLARAWREFRCEKAWAPLSGMGPGPAPLALTPRCG
jgi:hypothetical protein